MDYLNILNLIVVELLKIEGIIQNMATLIYKMKTVGLIVDEENTQVVIKQR